MLAYLGMAVKDGEGETHHCSGVVHQALISLLVGFTLHLFHPPYTIRMRKSRLGGGRGGGESVVELHAGLAEGGAQALGRSRAPLTS